MQVQVFVHQSRRAEIRAVASMMQTPAVADMDPVIEQAEATITVRGRGEITKPQAISIIDEIERLVGRRTRTNDEGRD